MTQGLMRLLPDSKLTALQRSGRSPFIEEQQKSAAEVAAFLQGATGKR